ncbi:hypothetical protein [Streptomyces sp. NPDC050738]|uniref:hypothetical protein n=1 Tax=Streptomyces sp. NPDC050738 TaxID=3154744 RepID=UPI00342C48AD
MSRLAAGITAVALVSLTASGCMTVHGELEVVPSATKAEATQALQDFLTAYNKADKAYDPTLDQGRVTGALGAINQAGLKARHITDPGGNKAHQELELTDAKFAIPKKAGWPRYFVADTDSNRDIDKGPQDTRWVLAFVQDGLKQPWKVAYLSILAPSQVPAFTTDKDGWAQPAEPADAALAVAPKDLPGHYTSYLNKGTPADFAPGTHTSDWRATRKKNASVPGYSTQYVDQPLTDGSYQPLGLRTKDGGALVFFASKHFEQLTAAPNVRLPELTADVKALTTGTMKKKITKERMSNEVALVPAKGAGSVQVKLLGRLQGLTSAQGS